MAATCDSCAWFDETHHLTEQPKTPVAGYCRRYAPVPPGLTQKLGYAEPDKPRVAQWPIVEIGDWCGEHSSVERP